MGGRVGHRMAFWLLAVVTLAGCAAPGNHHATLWMNHAAEREALSIQVYRQALAAVDTVQGQPGFTALPAQMALPDRERLKPAVILDIDETVLDNGAYQWQLAATGQRFPAGWDDWVRQADAPLVPGAAAFLDGLQRRHVTAVFITNRACAKRPDSILPCPQEGDTIRNLIAAGVPGPIAAEDVMLAGEEADWGSDKETRRAAAGGRYRILAMVGDDLGDFLPGLSGSGPEGRNKAARAFGDHWGTSWFVLPNPMYGGWLRALDGQAAPPARH